MGAKPLLVKLNPHKTQKAAALLPTVPACRILFPAYTNDQFKRTSSNFLKKNAAREKPQSDKIMFAVVWRMFRIYLCLCREFPRRRKSSKKNNGQPT